MWTLTSGRSVSAYAAVRPKTTDLSLHQLSSQGHAKPGGRAPRLSIEAREPNGLSTGNDMVGV